MSESKKPGFMTLARERFKRCAEAEAKLREEALKDLKFRAGEQWNPESKRTREADDRPCLVVNRIPQFLNQVANEQRQNRPAGQINPVGDGADVETSEVIQGLVRSIEIASNSDVADDVAFVAALTGGFGYERVFTDYEGPGSFNQEIKIGTIPNPFAVYLDPAAIEPDRKDARFGFIVETLGTEEYKEQFPDSELASAVDFSSIGDKAPGWIGEKGIRIAEYFYIESKTRVLVELAGGETAYEDEIAKGVEIKKKRNEEVKTLYWCKINGIEVIEEAIELPGDEIPIIPVFGEELNIDGERQLIGMVRYARDPAMLYNIWVSAEAEMIALAPRAPWVGVEGQFEGFESDWATAHLRNHPYLEYKSKSLNGEPAPPPQRQFSEPPIQAIEHARAGADNDLKAVMGIYDASLGKRGPQESGKAVLLRQKESDTANLNYIDNLARAIKKRTRIIVSWIPKYYDVPRTLKIVDPDGTHRMVDANQPTLVKGVQRVFDLTTGKYDITVSVGPSVASRRQEGVASMLDLIKAFPEAAQFVADLMVRQMDWPGAQEIADRLKKMLPPQLQENDGEQQPVPPAIQQKLQQTAQIIDQLTAEVHKLVDERNTKALELASKERIVQLQVMAQLMIEEAKINSKEGQTVLLQEIGVIKHKLEMSMQDKTLEAQTAQTPAAPEGQAA